MSGSAHAGYWPVRGFRLRPRRPRSAATTSTTGNSATIWASVPVRTASCTVPGTRRSDAHGAPREPRRYLAQPPRAQLARRVGRRTTSCPSSSCSMRCACAEGFAPALFSERTGLGHWSASPRHCAALEAAGTAAQHRPSYWRPSALGLRFLNDLLTPFSGPKRRKCLRCIRRCQSPTCRGSAGNRRRALFTGSGGPDGE